MIKKLFVAFAAFFVSNAFAQIQCTEYKSPYAATSAYWPSKEEAFMKDYPPMVTNTAACGPRTYKWEPVRINSSGQCVVKQTWYVTPGSGSLPAGCTLPADYEIAQGCNFASRLKTQNKIEKDIPIGYFALEDTLNPNHSSSPDSEAMTNAGVSAAMAEYCVGGRIATVADLLGVEQVTSEWVTSTGGIKLYQVFLNANLQPTCQSCDEGTPPIPTSSTPPPGATPNAPGIDAPNGVRPPGCEGYDICADGTSDGGPDGDGTTGGTGGDTGGTGGDTGGTGGDTGGTGGDTGGTGGDTGGTGGDTGGTGGDGSGGTDPDDSDGEAETGELCGAPGQPVCKVKIDESGTAEIDETKFQLSEDLETATQDHLDKITGLEDKGGLFDSFRSLFTLPPLRSCEAIQFPEVAGMTVPPMDPCPATDWLRGIMAFVWAAAGLAFCWSCVEEATKV